MSAWPFIVWTTLVSVLSIDWSVHYGIDLRLAYFILPVNLLLLLFFRGSRLSFGLLGFLAIILVLAVLYEDPVGHVTQWVGITFFTIYFYLFLSVARDRGEILLVYEDYVRLAVIVTALGFLPYLYALIATEEYRYQGLFGEPAHFGTVIAPALLYVLSNVRSHPLAAGVLLAAYVLTMSLVAYVALVLALFLIPGFKGRYRLIALGLAVSVAAGGYLGVQELRLRVNDTIQAIATQDLRGVNLSTYAFISNAYVAYRSALASPAVGAGLGSHAESHEKYIENIRVDSSIPEQFRSINAEDANSLFLRLVSELGLLGMIILSILLIGGFVARGWPRTLKVINRGCLAYIAVKLLREGHYFTPELYFYVFLYLLSGARETLNQQLPPRQADFVGSGLKTS